MLAQRPHTKELPKGLDAAWDAAAGVAKHIAASRKRFLRRAKAVLAKEKDFVGLADARLREKALEYKEVFRLGRDSPEHLAGAFALVREVASRKLQEKPYPVQVAGALALNAGCIVEMATGEGKTLTATMPAVIAGWRGRGCHVVTVNDYLAQRDAEWMRQIYRFCGLQVAHVKQGMARPDRRQAYTADITYGTNKEITADFLRDQLSLGRLRDLPSALLAKIVDGADSGTSRLVMRGMAFAIVDEADSVLIDEAVTPLIISGAGPNPEQADAFQQAASIASGLIRKEHYKVNERYREVDLTSAGKARVQEAAAPLGGVWSGARRREELIVQALVALHFYARDKQYIIEKGKVVIVDDFTGRLMPDRTWRDGLHQAIEAKEAVPINPPKETLARISFQRFFRLYEKLSGMTGTAAEARREFWQIYHLPVVVLPTHRPCIRRQLPDRVLPTEEAKWQAVVGDIHRLHATGRPILVGTRSVRASEHLSELLQAENLSCQVLNAVRHAEEAQIVAAAGQEGKITVATNMAGRGTDIKLGRGVKEKGGLHVIATERHESGRVDRQLYGRCGRQGDPGTAQAIVSLEDELVGRYAPHAAKTIRRFHSNRDVRSASARRVFGRCQRRAERLALRQRKAVLRTDDWLDEYLGFAGSA